MSEISDRQATEQQLSRLAAQRQLYSDAKKVLTLHMVLSVPCAAIWSILATLVPSLRVYAASWGVIATVLDIAVFTPAQKSLREKAAKVQELFDCDVLHIEWNELKVGHRPDAETVAGAASRYRRNDPEYDNVRNWYPVQVEQLPIHLARLVCQRTNCWWDAELRRRYATYVILSIGTLMILLSSAGLIGGLSLKEFLLAVLLPVAPAFVWGLRQYREHRDAAADLDNLKMLAERRWSTAMNGQATPDRLVMFSRELQDEIFENRRKNPLIFDRIYRGLSEEHEELMNKGADALIEEASRRLS